MSNRDTRLLPRELTAITNCQDPPDVGIKLTGVHCLGVVLRWCSHLIDIRGHVPFSSAAWDFAKECFELVRTCALLLLIFGVVDSSIQL